MSSAEVTRNTKEQEQNFKMKSCQFSGHIQVQKLHGEDQNQLECSFHSLSQLTL